MIIPNPFRFFKAVLVACWYRLKGYRTLTTQRESIDRQSLCHACPFRVDEQCWVCSCWIPAKTALTTEKCPVGKWPRIKQKRALTPKVKG